MCDVATIGLGLQGAGVAGNYIAERQTEAVYSKYQAQQAQATLHNYIQQTRTINNRYTEEQEATATQKQQIYIQNLQSKATAQASAASAGVDGITIENLFQGYDRATAVSNYIASKNLQMKGLQYSDELEGLRATAINAINLQQPYVGNPSSTLLGGLGGLLSSYSGMELKKQQMKFYKEGRV